MKEGTVKLLDVVITIVVVVGLMLLFTACREDDDSTTIIQQPSAVPRVECCDFENHNECREIREALLTKRGFVRKNGVCFDECGRCFTGCPD